VLFAGIFLTMIPALEILRVRGGALGISEPWHFFWLSGSLSSFLDNAPTYLTFAALAQGVGVHGDQAVPFLGGPVPARLLEAIACGSVFMGANSYIGNGPNFMVKAIAEEQGVKMPSFFGYMGWSITYLIPIFVLVTLIFFRG
jgi:Na+/H+ antiporter NhaD/arsenite permease-like protein